MNAPDSPAAPRNFYQRIPLPVRILAALSVGVAAGLLLRSVPSPDDLPRVLAVVVPYLKGFSDFVLVLLGVLATPLIFISVARSLLQVDLAGKKSLVLLAQLMFNTVVAILVGIAVANVVRPGEWVQRDDVKVREADAKRLEKVSKSREEKTGIDLPRSIVQPFADNNIIAVIVLAVATGVALRQVRNAQIAEGASSYKAVESLLDVGFRATLVMLHWVFELVPLAVLAVVARVVAVEGFGLFLSLGAFILAVLLALSVQACYYLARIWMSSRFTPMQFLRGGADAFLTAFSTASSAATLPVTYACARNKLGVSEDSASLGIMVGGTFNHDGTALYEAMAALFVSQLVGEHLGFGAQLVLVVMAVFASVGAAGIPEAGLVTMFAVFKAVGLDPQLIPLLLTVDWFLDRCRTAINVMGDMAVTCIVDGRSPPAAPDGKMTVEPTPPAGTAP